MDPLFANSFFDFDKSVTVTASTEDASHLKEDAYDNDHTTFWESQGSDDLTQETYDVDFGVSKNVDFFTIRGMNLKNFKLQYWTGAAWSDIAGSTETTYALDYYVLQLGSTQTTQKIRLVMNEVQSGGGEKQVAEFLVGEVVFERAPAGYKQKTLELAGMQRTPTGRAVKWFEWKKESWNLPYEHMSSSEFTALKTLKETEAIFINYPDPVIEPGKVFLAIWVNMFESKWSSAAKGAGRDIPIRLEEA